MNRRELLWQLGLLTGQRGRAYVERTEDGLLHLKRGGNAAMGAGGWHLENGEMIVPAYLAVLRNDAGIGYCGIQYFPTSPK